MVRRRPTGDTRSTRYFPLVRPFPCALIAQTITESEERVRAEARRTKTRVELLGRVSRHRYEPSSVPWTRIRYTGLRMRADTRRTVLAKLAPRFGPSTEDIAVEALAHILSESEATRRALADVLHAGGVTVEPIARVRTQTTGEDSARPDLAGFDQRGRECVLIEAKFWAGLTGNQPVAYLKRLPDNDPSVLLFVAPAARNELLWAESAPAGVGVAINHDAGVVSQGGGASECCCWRRAAADADQLDEPPRSHGGQGGRRRGFAHGEQHRTVTRACRFGGRRCASTTEAGAPSPRSSGGVYGRSGTIRRRRFVGIYIPRCPFLPNVRRSRLTRTPRSADSGSYMKRSAAPRFTASRKALRHLLKRSAIAVRSSSSSRRRRSL